MGDAVSTGTNSLYPPTRALTTKALMFQSNSKVFSNEKSDLITRLDWITSRQDMVPWRPILAPNRSDDFDLTSESLIKWQLSLCLFVWMLLSEGFDKAADVGSITASMQRHSPRFYTFVKGKTKMKIFMFTLSKNCRQSPTLRWRIKAALGSVPSQQHQTHPPSQHRCFSGLKRVTSDSCWQLCGHKTRSATSHLKKCLTSQSGCWKTWGK